MKSTVIKTMAMLAVILLVTSLGLAGTKVVLEVEGLSCPFCAYGLEKKLKKVKNVASVFISMNDGQAIVSPKEGAKIEENDLRKAVKDAGFSVSSIKTVDSEGGEKRQGGHR
ncbi:MAG: heavy-metal-associated domain-containing protein [Acidobacteriota bacterium]